MSIKLSDAKLFIIKDGKPIKIQILQNTNILFYLETISNHSPIQITLPIIEGNQFIEIQINDFTYQLQPDELELNTIYKLKIEEKLLEKGVINALDNYALTFKVLSGDSLKTISSALSNYQKIKSKLYSIEKGTSQYQSASSLQHSIPEISFSQAQRFITLKQNNQTEFNYDLPSTKIGRSTSFGLGNKQIISEYQIRNAIQNPSPNTYYFQENENRSKSNWGKDNRWKLSNSAMFPSPASYDISQDNQKPSYSFGKKNSTSQNIQNSIITPAPNAYNIESKLVQNQKFNKISFGFGNKLELGSNSNSMPGPGSYDVTSIFQKNSLQILSKKNPINN